MIYIVEFILFIIFCSFKLYYYLDSHLFYSMSGGKLNKYKKNLKNITCSFSITECIKNFDLKYFFSTLSCWCKQIALCLFVSTVIFAMKICLSYNFLVSNCLFINFFGKTFDISQFLNNKYTFFKIIYYMLYFLFVFYYTYKLYRKYISYKNLNKSKEVVHNEDFSISIKTEDENDVVITDKGLYQNVLITGSIGSGKTSSAISNILAGLIENNLGGLIIDIKGDYVDSVEKIAKKYNRENDIVKISINNEFKYNPLHDNMLSSSEMAHNIKKVLTLLSNENQSNEPFWLDKAEEYIRYFITLIKAYNNKNINFEEIHNLVISKEYIEVKIKEIKKRVLNNEFRDEELFEINNAILNIKNEYLNLDSRTFGIIRAEITRMTSIFVSNVKNINKYCKNSQNIDFLSNKIYVLSLDIANNEKLSKIIATYIKLDFQRQVLRNLQNSTPVFYICDEYQEIVNYEDANFFSLSRQYKCINVVSMQSYSSLINTLKNEHTANVIIQNFVNKIWFRNDDEYTVNKIISTIGKEKVYKKTNSYSENAKNSKYSVIFKRMISYKSDFSESYSESEVIQNKFNNEYFTHILKTFEAMCMISNGEKIELYDKIKIKRWEEDNIENKIEN